MAAISVICLQYETDRIYCHGKARSGEQRYRCQKYHYCFQLDYRYEANQSIERQNLNFRTRIKWLTIKTICFSKSEEIHDKVIGELINRELFQLI